MNKFNAVIKKSWIAALRIVSHYRIGLLVFLVITCLYFAPLLARIGSYSEGGDAMFNAWTLSRNHHCLLMHNCPSYFNGNIYFPNKDSMLFSETQLSAGILTLPLYSINQNPVFSYNVWTILSFFFAGFFMYMLAKKLSGNKEFVAITAGLIFEFAPIKLANGGPSHLQNLSIFYLPLILFFILRYFSNSKNKRSLIMICLLATLQFYASWYVMVFVIIGLFSYLLLAAIAKLYPIKSILRVIAALAVAVILTLPLAQEYVKFSRRNKATFTISDQINYSSSVADYFIPSSNTVVGKIYHTLKPNSRQTSHNPDSASYHGITLYFISVSLLLYVAYNIYATRATLNRVVPKNHKLVAVFFGAGIIGLLFSLGPLIKLRSTFTFESLGAGITLAIPGPWLVITKFLPQLNFIRAIGRISIIYLFYLCCLLSLLPWIMKEININNFKKTLITATLLTLILLELLPLHLFQLSARPLAFQLGHIPEVYKFIKSDNTINNIIILRQKPEKVDDGFPFTRTEDILWAGYHNRNIFNGYSGYEPQGYQKSYADYLDLRSDDKEKLQAVGLKFVLIDERLTSKTSPLQKAADEFLGKPIFDSNEYKLYRL